MLLCLLYQIATTALLVSAVTPTKSARKRSSPLDSSRSRFVSTKDGRFFFNGSVLNFVGTNAYWLAALNTEDDIDFTLGNMSAKGIKVVRTWAFNDVETIPETGTWFQLIANGTTTLNHGPNGLPKLDTVVRLAEKHGIFLQLSLTNNWNPFALQNSTGIVIEGRDVAPVQNRTLPRNTLSNDYGGMDTYVRQLGSGILSTHDEFYTNPVIQAKFKEYTTNVVSRYTNKSSVFGWEIANDPRCNSTLQSSSNCNTTTITEFHANITAHIKSVDPHHLVTSGTQGFLCMDCAKKFPPTSTSVPSMASPSAVPSALGLNRIKPLTKRKLLDDRKAAFKKSRALKQKAKGSAGGGMLIRGRWKAPETKRQAPDMQDLGPAFDGSQGVDSQDIFNIPNLDFGTFQLFPDQNSYGMDDPNLPPFNNTVNQGLAWIQTHSALGKLLSKPILLNGFGLVTQNNSQAFVPFNSTQAPFGSDSNTVFGVTDDQQQDAYTQWIQAGLKAGLLGMLQYQWEQDNLTTSVGTAVSPNLDGTGVSGDTTGNSPNDGYAFQGIGFDSLTGIIQTF